MGGEKTAWEGSYVGGEAVEHDEGKLWRFGVVTEGETEGARGRDGEGM